MTTYYNDQVKVLVSVDCIIFGFSEGSLRVLIGKRQMDPGRGQWSLYGGFVKMEENLDEAANRVLLELTGLNNLYMRQVGAFGQVDRDPGERVISVVYYALINTSDYDIQLQREHGVEWIDINNLPPMYSDHRQMIIKAREMMKNQIAREPIGFNLLSDLFTLTQLQKLYEAVKGEEMNKRNFRKRIKEMTYIEKTERIDKTTSKRGAYLYRFNKRSFKDQERSFKL